jgi:hypothetical protein
MFLNYNYRAFPSERMKAVFKIFNILEGLNEISQKSKDFSKNAKSLLAITSVQAKKEIDSIIKREHLIIELSQITDNHSGDAKEHRWTISSLEEMAFQRWYKDRAGSIPEISITVKDRDGKEIFSISYTEWVKL